MSEIKILYFNDSSTLDKLNINLYIYIYFNVVDKLSQFLNVNKIIFI